MLDPCGPQHERLAALVQLVPQVAEAFAQSALLGEQPTQRAPGDHRRDRARSLLQTLSSRAEDEQRHVAATLNELETTIRREAFGEDGAQESLFANIELEGDQRQVERDREALRSRLDAIPGEIAAEHRAVARRYADPRR